MGNGPLSRQGEWSRRLLRFHTLQHKVLGVTLTEVLAMGVLLMLATILAAGAAIVAAIAAGYFHFPGLARATQIGVLTWGTAYTALLISTSLTSREHVLRPGDVKRFCGFYLDCHMGAGVADVRRTATLGAPPNEVRAAGEFYVVTVKVTSNARRATLRLTDPTATVVDAAGRSYPRSKLGERALANGIGAAIPLNYPVTPNSQFTTPIVFDLPTDVRDPKLRLTDTPGIDRAIEGLLVGDEDSFLHKRTYHALTAGGSTIADGRRPERL